MYREAGHRRTNFSGVLSLAGGGALFLLAAGEERRVNPSVAPDEHEKRDVGRHPGCGLKLEAGDLFVACRAGGLRLFFGQIPWPLGGAGGDLPQATLHEELLSEEDLPLIEGE